MKKIVTLLFIFVFIASLTSCKSETTDKNITFDDDAGRKIMISKAEKIISLLPSDTEIMYALGAEDKLIGVSDFCNYPEQVSEKKVFKTGIGLNVEEIISAMPDIVFMGKMSQSPEQAQQLENAGITVIITEPHTIEETYKWIEAIGMIVSHQKEATSVVNNMKQQFDQIKKLAKDLPAKNVYMEISPLQYGLWTVGKNTFIQEIFDMTNIHNVFSDVESFAQVSEEQVIAKNPDIILSIVGADSDMNASITELKSRPNWNTITAVKNDAVYHINADILSRPCPRLTEGAMEILKAVYGLK